MPTICSAPPSPLPGRCCRLLLLPPTPLTHSHSGPSQILAPFVLPLPISGSQTLVPSSSSLCSLSVVTEARLDSLMPWDLQAKAPPGGSCCWIPSSSWLPAACPVLQLQGPCFLGNPLTSKNFQLLTLGGGGYYSVPVSPGERVPPPISQPGTPQV